MPYIPHLPARVGVQACLSVGRCTHGSHAFAYLHAYTYTFSLHTLAVQQCSRARLQGRTGRVTPHCFAVLCLAVLDAFVDLTGATASATGGGVCGQHLYTYMDMCVYIFRSKATLVDCSVWPLLVAGTTKLLTG